MKRRALFAIVAALAIALVAFVGWRWWLHWRLAALEAELRAAGNPLTANEFAALYPASDPVPEYNDIARAFSMLLDSPVGGVQLPAAPVDRVMLNESHGIPDSLLPSLDAYLAAHEEVIELLRRGTANELTRFSIGPDTAATTRRDPFFAYTRASRLLDLHVAYLVHQGRSEDAVESTVAARRLADLLRDDPSYRGQRLRFVVIEEAFDTARYLLREYALTSEQLDVLAEVWRDDDPRRQMRLVWQGVFCLQSRLPASRYMYLHRLAGGTFTIDETADTLPGRLRDFITRPRTQTYWFNQPRDLIFALEIYGERMAVLQEPVEFWEDHTHDVLERMERIPPSYLFTTALVRPLLHLDSEVVRSMDQREIVLAAIAVERYRLDHNALPDTWEIMVPEYLATVPRSAYGRTLDYRRDSDTSYTIANVDISSTARNRDAERGGNILTVSR